MDTERAQRDKQIEEVATEFFAAQLELDAAKSDFDARVASATRDAEAAVLRLSDLGETSASVAQLLEVDAKEINRIRRAAAAAKKEKPATEAPGGDSSDE